MDGLFLRKTDQSADNYLNSNIMDIQDEAIPRFDGDFPLSQVVSLIGLIGLSEKIKNQKIQFNSMANLHFESYQVPDKRRCLFIEAAWGSVQTFSHIPFDDLIFLWSQLLLEVPLIINSENQALLTCVIQTLISLLKPFKWPFSVFFSLHNKLLDYMDSPVPIIIGLNCEKVQLAKILETREPRNDAIYVDLDLNEYKWHSDSAEGYSNLTFGIRMEAIRQKYKNAFCNKEPNHLKAISPPVSASVHRGTSFFTAQKKNKMPYQIPLEKQKMADEIVEDIYRVLDDCIVGSLPAEPSYQESKGGANKMVDIEKIREAVMKKNEMDQKFLDQFTKRQMFEIFVYMHYEKMI